MKTEYRHDALLIIIIAIAAAVLLLILRVPDVQGEACAIYVRGELYGEYALTEDARIEIDGCTVLIENGSVRMLEADCPNNTCVKHAPISKAGEMICCLPNAVLIRVTGEAEYDFLI